jgi:hypothetical protein
MASTNPDGERLILEALNISIKTVIFRLVLTDKRVILFDDAHTTSRNINIREIQKITSETHPASDPAIILSVFSQKGDVRQIILHFSQRLQKNRQQERDQWVAEITALLCSE